MNCRVSGVSCLHNCSFPVCATMFRLCCLEFDQSNHVMSITAREKTCRIVACCRASRCNTEETDLQLIVFFAEKHSLQHIIRTPQLFGYCVVIRGIAKQKVLPLDTGRPCESHSPYLNLPCCQKPNSIIAVYQALLLL